MVRPTSLRRSLLINLVAVIVFLGGSILAVTWIGARRAVRTLSTSLIERTIDLTELQLRRFFEPVARQLRVAGSWGELGLLDPDDPAELDRHFLPMMRQHPHISSLIVADGRGREYLLLRTADGWSTRQTRRDEWGDRTRWRRWTDRQAEPEVSWQELDYDPRTRPWFQGAVAARKSQERRAGAPDPGRQLHWTEPYIFYTAHEPGITASLWFDRGDGVDHVVGIDVLLRDISGFTTALRVSEGGGVMVLDSDLRIIGLPANERYADPARQTDDLLKRPEELGWALATDAVGAFADQARRVGSVTEPVRFSSGGSTWWGAVRPFPLTDERSLWISVVVPEAELLGNLQRMRLWIILITLGALVAAVLRVVTLSKRFSRPIEELVRRSDRISRGDLGPSPPIDSTVSEVVRLGEAQDRMRAGLQSLMKLERDLQLARQIQQSTFPATLPDLPGFQLAAWSEPAEETGGDTYDVIGIEYGPTPGPQGERPVRLASGRAERAVLLLADAAGHGIGPALAVTQVRAMLRMAVRTGQAPPSIARHLNEQLAADLPDSRFITAWLGELSSTDHTLTSFSAGQGPLLLYRAGDDQGHVLPADTVPLGVLDELDELDVAVGAPIRLETGDIFAVISDGILEAADPNGRLFGVERTMQVIRARCDAAPREILDAIRHAVDAHTAGAPAEDDRTGLIIKRE